MDHLEVSWNLGHRAALSGIYQNSDFEFSRIFAMMSHCGWRDHFVVPLNGGRRNMAALRNISGSSTAATYGSDVGGMI